MAHLVCLWGGRKLAVWCRCVRTRRREMMTRELARLISTLGKLPREQRYAVVTEVASIQSRASSIDVIEAEVPALPECPHSASSHTIERGLRGGLQRFRFRCRHRNRTFNTLTGTPCCVPTGASPSQRPRDTSKSSIIR